ncbi:S8 family serine peptidase [Proteiniborus sp.]|uniref:S8 family serine peptidase n=1 Tax=Proteiniborus sp. TaxID=2079015 RepID=UPI003322FAB0
MKYIKENLKEFETCNILTWHNLGYTGKGIKIANMEACCPSSPIHEGKVLDPFNIAYKELKNSHGDKTANVLHQIAPDATIYSLSDGFNRKNDYIYGNLVDNTIPFIKENRICLVNASLEGYNFKAINNIYEELKTHNVTLVTSAGNIGSRGLTAYAQSNVWIAVGAAGYNDWTEHKPTIFLKDYSSIGKELDLVSFSGLAIRDVTDYDRAFEVDGTSFSSPMFCGMLALVQQLFLEKTGRTLYQDEIELLLQDNLIDLGAAGWDEKFGHGLFILPHPNEIDVNKYLLRGQPPKGGEILKFPDVKKDRWSAADIDLVSNLGIMQGLPDGTFAPAKPVTREELATVIARLIREGYIKK